MKTRVLMILFLIIGSTGVMTNSFAETIHITEEYHLITDSVASIGNDLFFVSLPYLVQDESNRITTFHGVNFTIPYNPNPPVPGGIRSTTITFPDGTVERLSQGVSSDVATSFTQGFGLKVGLSRHPNDTFFFLVSINSEPPLKQIKDGIDPKVIKCKESLILVTKYDSSPTCIKPETKIKLVERGWTQISESKQLSLYSNKFPNIEERNIQVNVGDLRISQTGLSVMVLEKTSRTESSRSIMFQQVTPSYSGSFNSDDVLYEFFKVSSGDGEENITEAYYDTPISNTVIAGNDKEYFSVYFPIEIPLKSSVQNSIIQFNYSLPYITPDFDQKYSFGLVSLSPLTINLPDDAKLIRNEINTYSNFWFFDKSGGELSHMTDGYMLYYGSLNPPIKIQNLIVYNVEFELDAKK